MLALLKKAKWVFLIVFGIFAFSFLAGYSAGKLEIVKYQSLKNYTLFKVSSRLENHVPGYGGLIDIYKNRHDKLRDKYLSSKNHWGMRALIFLNNWIVANLTMFFRSIFVLPIGLSIFGKFFQGVVLAQVDAGSQMWLVFLNEFGGYFLTIAGTLTMVFWTMFYKFFKFGSRVSAFISGLKVLGFAYLISGLGMLIGSILETDFIFKIYSTFK